MMDFRELRLNEVRRIAMPRTRVHKMRERETVVGVTPASRPLWRHRAWFTGIDPKALLACLVCENACSLIPVYRGSGCPREGGFSGTRSRARFSAGRYARWPIRESAVRAWPNTSRATSKNARKAGECHLSGCQAIRVTTAKGAPHWS